MGRRNILFSIMDTTLFSFTQTKLANSKYRINQKENQVPIVLEDDSEEKQVDEAKLSQNTSLIVIDDEDEIQPTKLSNEKGFDEAKLLLDTSPIVIDDEDEIQPIQLNDKKGSAFKPVDDTEQIDCQFGEYDNNTGVETTPSVTSVSNWSFKT